MILVLERGSSTPHRLHVTMYVMILTLANRAIVAVEIVAGVERLKRNHTRLADIRWQKS